VFLVFASFFGMLRTDCTPSFLLRNSL